MKKMKRLMGLMLCVVLAISCLTGCGGTEEEVLISAVTSLNEAKSYETESSMKGKMKIEVMGETQEVDIASVVKGTYFMDPYKVKTTTTSTVLGQTTTSESYMEKDGDAYVVYTKTDGIWSKMELGELEAAMQASGLNNFQSQFSTDASKYTKKDDRVEDDKTYLVYDYTISKEEVKKMTEGLGSSMKSLLGTSVEAEEMEKLFNTMLSEIGEITMTILVDKEEKTIYRIEYSMTEMVNKMLDAVMEYLKETMEESSKDDSEVDMQEALSSVKMQVSDMNMVMTYKNRDNVADFEIPEEAKNAEDLSSVLNGLSEDAE